MAGDARAEHGVVGAHIGVVGRDVEAADQHVIARHSLPPRAPAARPTPIIDEFALAGFRRGGGAGAAAAAGLSVAGCSGASPDGARGLFGHMSAELLGQSCGRRARTSPSAASPAPAEDRVQPGLSLRPFRPP